jgi:hypothetical protein
MSNQQNFMSLSETTKPLSKKFPHLIFAIFSIAVLTVLLAVGLIILNKENALKDFETFNGNGFDIQYPKDWYVNELSDYLNYTVLISNREESNVEDGIAIVISAIDAEQFNQIENSVEIVRKEEFTQEECLKLLGYLFNPQIKNEDVSKKNLDGISTCYSEVKNLDFSGKAGIYLFYEEERDIFYSIFWSNSQDDTEKITDNIISTFKLTNNYKEFKAENYPQEIPPKFEGINSSSINETYDNLRRSDILEVLNAITQYLSEKGNSISDLGTIPNCSEVALDINSPELNFNILVEEDYLPILPIDPSLSEQSDIFGYEICQLENRDIQISAPFAAKELLEKITL